MPLPEEVPSVRRVQCNLKSALQLGTDSWDIFWPDPPLGVVPPKRRPGF